MRSSPFLLSSLLLAFTLCIGASAHEPAEESGAPRADPLVTLRRLVDANAQVAAGRSAHFFDAFQTGQHPSATVVSCSDSRVQSSDLEPVPDGDLFVVRNIGNQVDTAAGSVEYGVRHLKTPLLLIVGHVGCGAIKAALSDYTDESAAVRHEIDGLHLAISHAAKSIGHDSWLDGVTENVHLQVTVALAEYKSEVERGELTIVGALYDFSGALGHGKGRLAVIDINGDRDLKKIEATVALPTKVRR